MFTKLETNTCVPIQKSSPASDGKCIHCKQSLTTTSELASGFCCSGCHAAYHFIQGLGLEYFYCLRDKSVNPKINSAPEIKSTYAYYNDQAFEEKFILIDQASGVSSLHLQISGLTCSACVWLLERLALAIPGIIEIRVDLMKSRVKIRFNPELIRPSAVAHSISSLGYTPNPISLLAEHDQSEIKDRKLLMQLGVAAFSAMNVMLLFIGYYQGYFSGIESNYLNLFAWGSLLLSLPSVTFAALPFYRTSLAALKMRKLHIDQPITLAILAGFALSAVNTFLGKPEIYFDTVTALIFLLLCGRWVQRKALNQICSNSDLLFSIAPIKAVKINALGYEEEVFVNSLKPGDYVVVPSNSLFPADGKVINGCGYVSNAVLTGESALLAVGPGSEVWAGTKNSGPALEVKITQPLPSSRLGNIIEKISGSSLNESKIARFVDRISLYFVLTVLLLALSTFAYWSYYDFWTGWDRVLALLVVSCPCALGIATPVTLSLTSNNAAKRGILLRSADALEKLAGVNKLVFDKTGTITSGNFSLNGYRIFNSSLSEDFIWSIVRSLEKDSSHPCAASLLKMAVTNSRDVLSPLKIIEVPGRGILGHTVAAQQITYRIGNINWLQDNEVVFCPEANRFVQQSLSDSSTLVGLSQNSQLLALFAIADTIRSEAPAVIRDLTAMGISSFLLSGDLQTAVDKVSEQIGLPPLTGKGGLSPEEKGIAIGSYKKDAAFVGDGINDLLAFKNAAVGIGISGGAEACLKVADIFITIPDLNLITEAVKGARQTLKIIHSHLAISFLYNATAATLAILGYVGPLAAAIVMPLSSLTVISSSVMRAPFRGVKQ